MEQKLRPLIKDKKAILGLDTTKAVMLALLVLAVIYIAVSLALVSLRDAGIFTEGSEEEADINNTIRNIASAGTSFFKNAGTFMSILVVVVIISIIAIVIAVVSDFGGTRGRL